MIDVWICDDHKIVVEGLRLIINKSGVAKVNANYYDLKSCSENLAVRLPDVLLLDVELPDGNGVDFCFSIIKLYPNLKIIMLTSHNEFSIAKRSLKNGALGFVLKKSSPEEIIAAIQEAASGETYICKETEMLLKEHKKERVVLLTAREKEVIKLIADGYSNPEIADMLKLSLLTVKGYRQNLLIKFNAKNSSSMVQMAIGQQLV
ncbi:MAG: response regulator transcription factor [Prevotellaceae bacterium]|jgi:DNA-binding NarL/FixJ family response regulator|nr:response regulator transcription factor [Prevotellaceae bacterium]